MELRQLKYFLTVADKRSFAGAAEELFISRQAISRSIAQLEAELQVELFMRDSGGAYLTPTGIMFYERVRSNVLELEQLQAEVKELGTQFRQVIRVAFSIGTLPLYEARIQHFIRTQNHIMVHYTECTPNECAQLLREHQADLVITSRIMEEDMFDSQVLYESPYGILLRDHENLEDLEALSTDDLRWLPLGCFADGQSQQLCASLGLSPQYTGIDLFRFFAITAQGQCAVLLPLCMLPDFAQPLKWFPLQEPHRWKIFRVYLRSMEKNALYYSAVDEFLMQVFDHTPT